MALARENGKLKGHRRCAGDAVLVIEPEVTWEMRVIPGIHANLSIADMDFGEFAESADADGVFRGFHA